MTNSFISVFPKVLALLFLPTFLQASSELPVASLEPSSIVSLSLPPNNQESIASLESNPIVAASLPADDQECVALESNPIVAASVPVDDQEFDELKICLQEHVQSSAQKWAFSPTGEQKIKEISDLLKTPKTGSMTYFEAVSMGLMELFSRTLTEVHFFREDECMPREYANSFSHLLDLTGHLDNFKQLFAIVLADENAACRARFLFGMKSIELLESYQYKQLQHPLELLKYYRPAQAAFHENLQWGAETVEKSYEDYVHYLWDKIGNQKDHLDAWTQALFESTKDEDVEYEDVAYMNAENWVLAESDFPVEKKDEPLVIRNAKPLLTAGSFEDVRAFLLQKFWERDEGRIFYSVTKNTLSQLRLILDKSGEDLRKKYETYFDEISSEEAHQSDEESSVEALSLALMEVFLANLDVADLKMENFFHKGALNQSFQVDQLRAVLSLRGEKDNLKRLFFIVLGEDNVDWKDRLNFAMSAIGLLDKYTQMHKSMNSEGPIRGYCLGGLLFHDYLVLAGGMLKRDYKGYVDYLLHHLSCDDLEYRKGNMGKWTRILADTAVGKVICRGGDWDLYDPDSPGGLDNRNVNQAKSKVSKKIKDVKKYATYMKNQVGNFLHAHNSL